MAFLEGGARDNVVSDSLYDNRNDRGMGWAAAKERAVGTRDESLIAYAAYLEGERDAGRGVRAKRYSTWKKAGSKVKVRKIRESMSKKAHLQFPVARVKRHMRKMPGAQVPKRVSDAAAVYTAAVLEYMTAEVLELAGNVVKDRKAKRITPRDIMFAIRNDEEMSAAIGKAATIGYGGVRPFIHTNLIKKTKATQ